MFAWVACAIICMIQWTFRYWHCIVSISAGNIWNCAARASEFYSNTADPICVFHWHNRAFKYSDIFSDVRKDSAFFYPWVIVIRKACLMEKKNREINILNDRKLVRCCFDAKWQINYKRNEAVDNYKLISNKQREQQKYIMQTATVHQKY